MRALVIVLGAALACGSPTRETLGGPVALIVEGGTETAARAILGVHDPASPAGRVGLVTGDAIVSVDGTAVATWSEAAALLTSGEHTLEVITAADTPRVVTIAPDAAWIPGWDAPAGPERAYGLGCGCVFVGKVVHGSAAAQAGVLPGDAIVSIAGRPVRGWSDLIALISQTPRLPGGEFDEITLTVVRGGAPIELRLRPEVGREISRDDRVVERPIIGIQRLPSASE